MAIPGGSVYGGEDKCVEIFGWKDERSVRTEDIGVDATIISKRILNK
jgi:hypothetical protein